MQANRQFSIPFKGLKFGTHTFEFEITDEFFEMFESSPIKKGALKAVLNLERKSDHLELFFETQGTVNTSCDRCTAIIDLPIEGRTQYIVKFGDTPKDATEIIFIHPESHDINVAEMLYEHIVLSIPLIKTFDCEELDPVPCNENILSYLEGGEDQISNNPFGEVLKDLKITKTK